MSGVFMVKSQTKNLLYWWPGLQVCNLLWALQENNALELANQNAYYMGYMISKFILQLCCVEY